MTARCAPRSLTFLLAAGLALALAACGGTPGERPALPATATATASPAAAEPTAPPAATPPPTVAAPTEATATPITDPERNLDSHADGDGYSGCANANADADCGCHGGRDAIAHDLPLQPPRHDRRGDDGRELRLPDDGRGRDERVRQPRCGAGGQRRAAHPSSGRKRNIPRGLLRHGEGR